MRSVKNAALGTVVLLFVLIVTTVKGYAAPAETSHWNSNTFGNLNTLADKTTVTFSITYNETGTIEWFKDGVLADTLSGATSAQFTTAWSETGMKEVKARMTNGGGTAETVWPVEVQETGDGLVEEYITYPQNRVNGHLTINVTNGWVNFQTLYLKTKDPENWLEYVSSGTYLMKANIRIAANGVLKADDGSARVLRIRALPLQNHFFGELDADFGGTVNIDSMTIVGWDVDLSTEIAITDQSAWIGVGENSTLKLKNSTLRWVQVRSLGGTTAHTEIDNNRFHGGNTFNLYMGDLANQTVSNNSFIYSGGGLSLVGCGGMHNTFIHNVFRGLPGGTLTVGSYCKVIDNDFSYSDWNQVEANNNVLLRDNLFHDNGGQHNGINQMWHNVYSINDTFHDFSNFSGCYSQVSVTGAQPEPWSQFADHVYIINAHAANVPRAFFFAGSHDVYIYNLLSEQSGGQIEFGTYNFFIRKSEFVTVKDTSSDFALCVPDWDPGAYRYVQNVTILDTVFSGVNKGDIAFFPAGSGIINAINCLRKNGDGSIKDPDSFISNVQLETGAKPEVRHYAWLDVLVKDQSGHLIKDANVTVECVTDPAAPPLKVTLPPPPPELWDLPEEYLPQPVVESFVRMKTLSTGKLPGPNYGWSANSEPCAALMYKKLSEFPSSSGGMEVKATGGYQYQIRASYHGLEAGATVLPDVTWLREDPTAPAVTVELVLNGDATTGTDTTPPALTITAPQNNKPVYGTTPIEVTASDNWDIDRLEIFIDSISRAVISADSCTWTADSYNCSWTWNTAQESDGSHNIKVVAYDISGNMTERTITVEVLAQASGTSDDAIVYPNPYIKGKSRGSTCTFANLELDATVRIYTISGDLVTTLTAEMNGGRASTEWDVSRVGGGIYLYTIHSSKGVQKGKVGIVK